MKKNKDIQINQKATNKAMHKRFLSFGEKVGLRGFFFLFLLISNICWSQSSNELFTNANNLYKEGKYQEAIDLYTKIEVKNEVSSELYYNLGNCYYKLNQVAPTIYNYEKALAINPLNQDAQNNLVFAKRLTLDRIEELPKSLLQKFNQNYLQKLTYNEWAIVTVIFSILASLLFLLFYFAELPKKKRVFFVLSILSFLFLTTTVAITYNQYSKDKNTVKAIIFAPEIEIKNAPTENSNTVFTLHEGTNVTVLDTVDNWSKIKLADGKIGWIFSDKMKLFNKF